MKTLAAFALAAFLCGCQQRFTPLLEQSKKAYRDESYVEAIDAANMALRRWTESDGNFAKAQAYEVLGLSYHHLKKMEKAIDAYQDAIRLSTATFESAYQLGVVLLSRSEPKLASKAFQAALRMKADDPLALVGLGNCFYSMQDFEAARLSYQRVVDTAPGVKESLEYLKLVNEKTQGVPAVHRRKRRR